MAAPVLSLESIGLLQGQGWLFRGLDLHVGERDRLALIGRNGAGKSTLFRILAGTLDFDEGRRTIRPGARVVLLEQEPEVDAHATLRAFALSGDPAPKPHEVDAIADRLGVDLDRPAVTASGGERRRAAIARALALDPDVLLLDEPTNHLDLAAIDWLEDWLGRARSAFIAISHDRAFLTRLTRSSLWLERGTLRRADIGFGGFEAWTEKVLEEEAQAAERLDSKLMQELHWLARGVTARRRRNQGRLRKLEAMRAERRAMLGGGQVAKLALRADETKTKIVIDAEGISKAFDGRALLRDFSIRIQRGDRIGVVGRNGAGKTTLLRLLTGEIQPDSGTVRLSKTLDGVLIDQQRRLLEPAKRVRDVLSEGSDWIDVRGARRHIAGYLKEFLFDPGLADAPVGSLSGGERSRLLLAREFARPSNLLVLDEPTNDLDLETLDLLQEVIADYEGTVLIVSHDRDFLDRTVTMVIGLDGSGRADVVAGGYADWEAKRRSAAPGVRGAGGPGTGGQGTGGQGTGGQGTGGPGPADRRADTAAGAPRRTKLAYKERRELDLLPGEMERLAAEIARHERLLDDAGLYARDPAGFQRLSAALEEHRRQLEAAEERWLELEARAEALATSG